MSQFTLPEEVLIKAIAQHTKRLNTFMNEGLSYDDAFDLANKLLDRDHFDKDDDRRLCFECTYYVKKQCTAFRDKFGRPTECLKFVLQRCEKFNLKGVANV